VIVVTLYRRVFARRQFRAVKPPLLRCGAENTHNNHYQWSVLVSIMLKKNDENTA